MNRQPCTTYTESFVWLFTQVIQSGYKHHGPVAFIFLSHRLRVLLHLDCSGTDDLSRINKYVPSVVLCAKLKQDKAHALEGLSSPYVTASCAQVALCSEESNCLVNIWADENISQIWDVTHNTVKFIKS